MLLELREIALRDRFADAAQIRDLIDGVELLPPNTTIQSAQAADPPYINGKKEDAQVILGTSYLVSGNKIVATLPLHGQLNKEVFTQGGPKEAFSMPRYGRVAVDPLLAFAGEASKFDLGVPGQWARPTTFQVQIEAGINDLDQRVDLASPDLDEPTKLSWTDDEAITPTVLRTNLSGESDVQQVTFLLGAIVGAGAASILTAIERIITSRPSGQDSDESSGPPPGSE